MDKTLKYKSVNCVMLRLFNVSLIYAMGFVMTFVHISGPDHYRGGGAYAKPAPEVDHCYAKPWVVYSEPPLGNALQIVNYLGQYTHRVAISNTRIKNINEQGVTFSYKDYKDEARQKLMFLDGVEFLRRFAMHILPRGFVKIRYFGILGSGYKEQVKALKQKPDIILKAETRQQRIVRLTGYDSCQCPACSKGKMQLVEVFPRIRSPGYVFYLQTSILNL